MNQYVNPWSHVATSMESELIKLKEKCSPFVALATFPVLGSHCSQWPGCQQHRYHPRWLWQNNNQCGWYSASRAEYSSRTWSQRMFFEISKPLLFIAELMQKKIRNRLYVIEQDGHFCKHNSHLSLSYPVWPPAKWDPRPFNLLPCYNLRLYVTFHIFWVWQCVGAFVSWKPKAFSIYWCHL